MDATNLQKLAGHLRELGLRVATLEPEPRLHATNPLHGILAEEIVAVGTTYVTGFGYEIGEHGHEGQCATRIAHLLAVPRTSPARTPSVPEVRR
ncbi:hypothetical protein ACIGJO_33920 [Streptomyces sp. NPDC079020]|uniref:hypothetical protein n=1 Tax=Streptomyces sp. NPDC079020 TaxID=3365722 RepID=UPI0037D6AB56